MSGERLWDIGGFFYLLRQGLAQQAQENLNDADLHLEWKEIFNDRLWIFQSQQRLYNSYKERHFMKYEFLFDLLIKK